MYTVELERYEEYSEFIKKPEQPSNTDSKGETDDEDNEGLVDYNLLYETTKGK